MTLLKGADYIKSLFFYIFVFSVTNPIDVTKVRLQLDNELVAKRYGLNKSPNPYYNGLFNGGVRIVKEEGIQGLYKG